MAVQNPCPTLEISDSQSGVVTPTSNILRRKITTPFGEFDLIFLILVLIALYILVDGKK